MFKGPNRNVLNINILNLGQASSMFVAIACCFAGFGVLAAVKEITEAAPHVELVLIISGCILVISGIYHTSSVVNQISDPYLFYFYNQLRWRRRSCVSEDPSLYMVGILIILLSSLIWTFMFSTGFGDTVFAAFATSALMPILALSIRIRKRLNLYRQVNEAEHLESCQPET